MAALNYSLETDSEWLNMLFGKMSKILLFWLESNNEHSDYIRCRVIQYLSVSFFQTVWF